MPLEAEILCNKEEKEKIIKVAKKLNPEIKIYQMTIDPDAFRLKEEEVESYHYAKNS